MPRLIGAVLAAACLTLIGLAAPAHAQAAENPVDCGAYRIRTNEAIAARNTTRLRELERHARASQCPDTLALIRRNLPAPTVTDPCAQPARDWPLVRAETDVAVVRSFRARLPAACATLRDLADARIRQLTPVRREEAPQKRTVEPTPPPPSLTPAQRALRAAQAGEAAANRRFRDCPDCPEMVAVPGGEFLLGSPAGEQGRSSNEGPQMRVTLRAFAAGRFEVTRAQYAAFTRETGRAVGGNCHTINSAGGWEQQQGATWQAPGFEQTGDHPVVCVSWEDAQAYVDWLNGKVAGRPYRLLSESEWEYAARAGTTSRFWWGDGEGDLCAYANGADQAARARFPSWTVASCNDGHVFTAPVGFSGRENRFGLADMAGNVLEWVQDCYNRSYDLTPTSGAANATGGCASRVVRGGSWNYDPQFLRSAGRIRDSPASRYYNFGFRLSRTL